jgi:hypothetical protein
MHAPRLFHIGALVSKDVELVSIGSNLFEEFASIDQDREINSGPKQCFQP